MPIYLIRHGQSEFNLAHKKGGPDPLSWDAPLTELGCKQALEAREQILDLGIEQVLTSPLTRAIQTAKIMFDGIAPIEVIPDHRELIIHSCDVGVPASVLREKFPELSFDGLDEVWWHQGAENENGVPVEPIDVFQKRIDGFAELISTVPDRPVAIIGNGNVFKALSGYEMSNCGICLFSGECPRENSTFS